VRELLESPEAEHQGHLREHRTISPVPHLDEQSFRFNERKANDAERFVMGLKGIINKRLTYVALTGSELPQTC
jgi:hypothetical protein